MWSGEKIANAKRTMKHDEVVIARRAVEEGRGLVVVVNKMDLLSGRQNSKLYERVIQAVPEEIQTVIPQVCPLRSSLYVCIFFILYIRNRRIAGSPCIHYPLASSKTYGYGLMDDYFISSGFY